MSIEKYDPIRLLGEGSFGKVYLMRDKVRRNFVCIKVIKIKNIPKKEREATRIEVELLRRLHHPNIVRYLDSFLSKNNDVLCIVMEYCDGGDLASQIKAARRNLFSESKIYHWFVQLALGLHYMHSNKVLHRDLKTQNVFLLGNGRLVLGDLGISKVLDGTMDFAQTCIGTPYYMSPEIFQNKPYSYKSDVWALGCVLYEMTTLNHAFDANSLNGLAGKIVKGRYPPIHHKYGKHLRDLIGSMLLINPQQRPDLDQILRKPFIRKHVVNFFSDIAARPTASVGEGTMIFRGAVGGKVGSALSNDSNLLALQKQLKELDMTREVADALSPKVAPEDPVEAKKFVKEQASALRREEDHKKMVEAALEKLRIERENRSKDRNAGIKKGKNSPPSQAVQQGAGGFRRDDPSRIAGQRQPVQQALPVPSYQQQPQPSYQQPVGNGPLVGGGGGRGGPIGAVRDGGLGWGERERERVDARRKPAEQNSNLAPVPSYAQGIGGAAAFDPRRRAVNEEKDNYDARRRVLQQQPQQLVSAQDRERERKIAAAAAEDRERDRRRREDVRVEAQAREEARAREEQRLREEAVAKQRMDELRQQNEAAMQRDLLREKERLRQREEIEQLKRDKLELDRLAYERERIREERRAEEKRKLDEAREREVIRGGNMARDRRDYERERGSSDGAQEKYTSPNSGMYVPPLPYRSAAADDKDASDGVSARERVLLRKQEKQARDEQERVEALREAELQNRRIRHAARAQKKNLYAPSGSNLAAAAAAGGLASYPQAAQEGAYYDDDEDATPPPAYEYGDGGRARRPVPDAVSEDMAQRLNDATRGVQSRYGESDRRSSDSLDAAVTIPRDLSCETDITRDGSDDDADDADIFMQRSPARAESLDDLGAAEEEDEDMYRREEELRAELNFATQRMQELQRTLNETRSIIINKSPIPMKPSAISMKRVSNAESDESDDDDYDEDDLLEESNEFDDDEEETKAQPEEGKSAFGAPKKPGVSLSVNTQDAQYERQPQGQVVRSYQNLQDPPTPSGRLSDRIERLRFRCIEALGESAFNEAYRFLKQCEEVAAEGRYDAAAEADKAAGIETILGRGRNHYTSLIEQLIFMEETHCA